MSADERADAKKTEQVAGKLRELILSGEWADGHELPSERDLKAQYEVSLVTLRRALDLLVGEGLIEKGQGRPSRVFRREPAYRLVINQALAGRVSEPPLAFVSSSRPGVERREWSQRTGSVPQRFAALLGLDPAPAMVERTMALAIDGEPILTSTSYLPADLAGELAGDRDGWQDVEIGQLALAGHAVTSTFMEEHSRLPTPAERATLGMPRGVLVKIVSHRCQVPMADRVVPVGVILLTRADRVRLRWYGPQPLGWPPT